MLNNILDFLFPKITAENREGKSKLLFIWSYAVLLFFPTVLTTNDKTLILFYALNCIVFITLVVSFIKHKILPTFLFFFQGKGVYFFLYIYIFLLALSILTMAYANLLVPQDSQLYMYLSFGYLVTFVIIPVCLLFVCLFLGAKNIFLKIKTRKRT